MQPRPAFVCIIFQLVRILYSNFDFGVVTPALMFAAAVLGSTFINVFFGNPIPIRIFLPTRRILACRHVRRRRREWELIFHQYASCNASWYDSCNASWYAVCTERRAVTDQGSRGGGWRERVERATNGAWSCVQLEEGWGWSRGKLYDQPPRARRRCGLRKCRNKKSTFR